MRDETMSTNEMYVRNTLIAVIGFVMFFAVAMGTVLYYKALETNEMQSCVKSGKEWTKIHVDGQAGSERVCIDKR